MPVAPRSSCSRAFLLALLTLSAGVPSVEAQVEHNASLIWMREPGAESCIDEAELVRRVEQHLGVGLEQHDDGLVIEGRIAPRDKGRGFVARLEIASDASSARELVSRDADCRALDDALVLVVAAAVETLAAAHDAAPSKAEVATEIDGSTYRPSGSTVIGPRARPAPVPGPAPAPIPAVAPEPEPAGDPLEPEAIEEEPTEDPVAADEPSRDPWLALRLALGPRLSLGLMPAAAGGGSIALIWPLSRALRVELGASLWPVGSRPTDQGDAHFQVARADVLGCPVWPIARPLSLVACAGPSAGGLRASGDFAATSERTSLRPVIGLMAWLFAELRLRSDDAFRVRAGVGASHELWRDRFAASDALGREVLLHRIAPWTALAALELSAAL
jgi:hypothetical protein